MRIDRREYLKYATAVLTALAAETLFDKYSEILPVNARYQSTYRTPIIVKDFKDSNGNFVSVDVVDDFDNYELWDSVNTYGNVSREVLNKKAEPEGIVKVGRDYKRNKLVWRIEDFYSETLRKYLKSGDCYAFNLSYDPFHLMEDNVSEQYWSEAITTRNFENWCACLAYGNSIEFPDPYPIKIDPVFEAKITPTKYFEKKHAVLVIEQDLTNKPQKLPLPVKEICSKCGNTTFSYESEIPKLCFNENIQKIGVDVRVVLNRVRKTRTTGDLVLPLLNEIPSDYYGWKNFWPQDNTVPREWADMELENKVYLPTETLTSTTFVTQTIQSTQNMSKKTEIVTTEVTKTETITETITKYSDTKQTENIVKAILATVGGAAVGYSLGRIKKISKKKEN